ncbi:MAG TPA: hypothetical protein VFY49_12045 [Myxococcota bacterium]|nr:hypothetical protein [Myxococcota bacterium]
MPEVHGDHLDVSAEEQRYLRRTFRRFALPWVLMAAVLGALAGAAPRWIEATPETGAPSGASHASEDVGPLHGEIATLSQRIVGLEAAVAKTRDRLVELEGRSSVSNDNGGLDTEALERRLEGFTARIVALESRAGSAGDSPSAEGLRLDAQIAALAERLARLETEQGGPRPDAPAAAYPPQ